MAETEKTLPENEVVLGDESTGNKTEPQKNAPPAKKKDAKGAVKEWFRKQTVALKRAPQRIPLVILAITTIYFLLALYPVSQAVDKSFSQPQTSATGICIFISTLLSLLVLVSFLNAFPKRKKPNVFFITLVFVMIAAIVACDLVYYIQMGNCMAGVSNPETSDMYRMINKAQPYVLVHVILLGVSALVFALLPVYKKLINKINTKVELESATENMKGEIDIQED